MFKQEYTLGQPVRVLHYDVETTVIGVAEPDRRPRDDDDEYRQGYRYLVEIQLPPKMFWLEACHLELADPDAGSYFDNMVPANTP